MATAFEKYAAGSDLKDVELPGGNAPRVESMVDMADFSDGEWHQVRLWPGVFGLATMWLDVKKKDGSYTQIPRSLLNFDIQRASFDDKKECPYYNHRNDVTCRGEPGGQINVHYYCNVLDRAVQDAEPKKVKISKGEKASGFKEKGSKSWTPLRVARFPRTVIGKLMKLQELNRQKGKSYPLSDAIHGHDIYVYYNKDAAPANMWDVQLDTRGSTKLTEEEQSYLMWDIEKVLSDIQGQESLAEAEKWMKRHLNPDVESTKSAKKGKKGKKGKVPTWSDMQAQKVREKVKREAKARKKNKKNAKKDSEWKDKRARDGNPPPF